MADREWDGVEVALWIATLLFLFFLAAAVAR